MGNSLAVIVINQTLPILLPNKETILFNQPINIFLPDLNIEQIIQEQLRNNTEFLFDKFQNSSIITPFNI